MILLRGRDKYYNIITSLESFRYCLRAFLDIITNFNRYTKPSEVAIYNVKLIYNLSR